MSGDQDIIDTIAETLRDVYECPAAQVGARSIMRDLIQRGFLTEEVRTAGPDGCAPMGSKWTRYVSNWKRVQE